jgi:hypothetical protein
VLLRLCDPSPVFAALSGLAAAAAYLVLRYAAGMPGVVTATQPTVVGAVGFTCAGLAATSFPLQSPWLPLSAPVAAVGICTLATRPDLDDSADVWRHAIWPGNVVALQL